MSVPGTKWRVGAVSTAAARSTVPRLRAITVTQDIYNVIILLLLAT